MISLSATALLVLLSVAYATELKTAEHVISLRKSSGAMSPSSQVLSMMRSETVGTGIIAPVWEGGVYVANVDLGGSYYDLIFDSGSSNLWVATTDFQCLKPHSETVQPLAACQLGKLYKGTFESGAIANENFNVSYGFGGDVVGTLGYEDVSVAGITIEHLEIALARRGVWAGDHIISGVIGFAYPALTNAFTGTDPAKDSPATNVPFNPFVFSAIAQGKIAPLFSLALLRGPGGGSGQIALGGLPKANFTHDFASTPIQIRKISAESSATNFTYYTITPDGYTLEAPLGGCCQGNGKNASAVTIDAATDFPFFVDSGSTFIFYPVQLADQVNGLFSPPAVYNKTIGAYQAPCDAVPPKLGVKIAGKTFFVNPEDMLLDQAFDQFPTPGLCLTGVQRAMGELSTLGDVFLRNVVAVYDIGASQMRFAAHEYY